MSRYIEKLSRGLFSNLQEQHDFVAALSEVNQRSTKKALIWFDTPQFGDRDPRLPDFITIVSQADRPGSRPEFEQGCYYVMDLSSALTSLIVTGVEGDIRVVLDACAAPGGKASFVSQYFSPNLLIANEPVDKRVKALIANFSRCKIQNACIISSELFYLTQSQPHAFDLVIVDAPCSGQSLVVRDVDVDNPFHPVTVGRSARKQRKILAESQHLIKQGGYLAYLTCTYAPEENEKNLSWFLKNFPQFSAVMVPALGDHQSHLTSHPCYRFFPHRDNEGAGGFAALLKRNDGDIGEACLPSLRIYWRSLG